MVYKLMLEATMVNGYTTLGKPTKTGYRRRELVDKKSLKQRQWRRVAKSGPFKNTRLFC